MEDQDKTMWQNFLKGLSGTTVGKGFSPASFIPTSGLCIANWEVMDTTGIGVAPTDSSGKPLPKGSTIVNNLEVWADTMPSWLPNYVPGNSFYQSYLTFLNSINLKGGDPAQQQIADALSIKVKTARDQLQADNRSMMTDWKAFNVDQAGLPASAQQTYNQWYNDNYAGTIEADKTNLAAALQDYNSALAAVGGPDFKTLNAAQDAATNKTNMVTGPDDNHYPAYTITPGLNDWFLSALQTVTSQKPPQIDFTIDLSQQQTDSSFNSQYAAGSVSGGYSTFFWGGSASYSASESSSVQTFTDLLQKVQMRYTAQAANLFNIKPGQWFNGSVVEAFCDQISPNSALANKQLFGPTGILNLEAMQLLVVFKPTVTLTADKNTIGSIVSACQQQSQASFNIGGFFWSGSANESQGSGSLVTDLKQSSDGTSVTIADNTNAPKIIGIVPRVLASASRQGG